MDKIKDLRKTEVFREGIWQTIPMSSLKKGELFRMFEPDGLLVNWGGSTIWRVTGAPYLNEKNIWTVNCRQEKKVNPGEIEGRGEVLNS